MATPIYSNAPVYNFVNGIKVQTGTVRAVTPIDQFGNYVVNPATGNAYLAPVGYSLESTVNKLIDLNNKVTSACDLYVTLQRQGVYFEAGFAIGLGIPVYWCVREDEKDKVHFDTRQDTHIVWSSPADLEAKLFDFVYAISGPARAS